MTVKITTNDICFRDEIRGLHKANKFKQLRVKTYQTITLQCLQLHRQLRRNKI